MEPAAVVPVEVYLGSHKQADNDSGQDLFGPLPARRLGDVVAYEMQAPANYDTWPGRSRVERKYALLDLGVSFGIPCWSTHHRADGSRFDYPPEQQDTWYVDLVTVELPEARTVVLRDCFIDIMIADRRQPRSLDFDEIADAHDEGWIPTDQLLDALRRWQAFLDRHLHADRFPQLAPTDFPPAAIAPLAAIDGVFGPPVTWPE